MLRSEDMRTVKEHNSLDQTWAMRMHIWGELKKEMGEEEFNSLHYLQREMATDRYLVAHEEELVKLYPKADLTIV